MPIQWRQFKELEKPHRFPEPNHFPESLDEDEWVPFMPTSRAEEPAVDIYQDKNNLYVEIPLIGVNPNDVEISIDDNILTIQGKKQEKKEVKEKDYLRKEIKKGDFRRVIKLPVEVKGNRAVAESVSGLLKITIPKAAKAIPQANRIPIKIK